MNTGMVIEKIKIWVQVHPNARRNEVQGEKDGVWQLKIAAPPVRGRANQELEIFLSQRLQVGKSAVSVVKGQTSRYKTVAIDGLSWEEIILKLVP